MSEKTYQITADSGCDLSLEKCREIDVLPYKMPFTMDGEPMVDEMTEESFKEFYRLMRAGGVAKTSQINPGEFLDFWRPLAEQGKDVLHISLALAISGSCDNARSAAAQLMEEYPGWTCRVVDSANASAGFGLLVMRAASNRDGGMSLEDNANDLESIHHEVNSIFTTNDLTYLYRGGRVSRTSAAFGTALKIVPIMHLDYEGHLEVWQKVRGDKSCFKKMVQDVKELVIDPGCLRGRRPREGPRVRRGYAARVRLQGHLLHAHRPNHRRPHRPRTGSRVLHRQDKDLSQAPHRRGGALFLHILPLLTHANV